MPDPLPPTILVVEPEPNLRQSICTCLIDFGFVVVGAATARDGLSALSHRPKCIIVYAQLPGRGGGVVLQEARDRGLTPLIVATISADERTDTLASVSKFHPARAFFKPFDPVELCVWVKANLETGV
jgi:DNA-binding response OmpR family regulator